MTVALVQKRAGSRQSVATGYSLDHSSLKRKAGFTMPNKPPPLLFDFRAHIDISNPPASAFPPANSHTASAAGASQPSTANSKVVTEKVIIDALNQDASQIADELRLEIRKNLSQDQNQYTVQVTISFLRAVLLR